ncbi:MAG: extracellular solute-binding protein [Clostridia bacterium]|nr:extracellular solute-binding protein [Clostridia bacterium]
MKIRIKQAMALCLALLLLGSGTGLAAGAQPADGLAASSVQELTETTGTDTETADYAAYRTAYAGAVAPTAEIRLDVLAAQVAQDTVTETAADGIGLMLTGETGKLTWSFSVEQAGLYCLEFVYASHETRYSKVSFSAQLDGAAPYSEWEQLALVRPYVYTTAADGSFTRDDRGNDIQPQQQLSADKVTADLRDADGKYNDPLQVYLTAGSHTLTLDFSQAMVTLYGLRFHPATEAEDYQTVYAAGQTAGAVDTTGLEYILRAECFDRKSDAGIQAGYDKSSAATHPAAPAVMSLNTLGGINWQDNGQWAEWRFKVEESGFYCLSLRARQNSKYGMNVLRRITIDGQVPFAEMNAQPFPYKNTWYMQTLGGEKTPYRFYLEAGEHTLRIEIVSGAYETVILELTEALTQLNALYRNVVMVTGTSPDDLRDYELEVSIPDLTQRLETLLAVLKEQKAYLVEGLIGGGSETSYLDALIVQMEGFLEDTETMPFRLDSFKTNISSLADWISTLSEQPLELDSIIIHSPDTLSVAPSAGFFRELWYDLSVIAHSFSADYGMIGDYTTGDEALTVWMNLGRDQLQVLKGMVDSAFTPQANIPVNLSLVPGGLIEAVLAGKGPDVALFVGSSDPVNLAARNAVLPVSDFADFGTVSENFYPDNLVPYQYKGKTYALPCTVEFPMMFVRTDVLAELGLAIPTTWDEMVDTAAILQRKNLRIGIPSGAAGTSGLYSTFLVQRGATYYNEGQTATRFHEEAAIDAFTVFTDFFTKYDFDLSYNFFNRFRTGEMPIGIDSYTMYNYLQAAAPELAGLWAMVPVPGTVGEDGSVNTTTTVLASSAAIILKTQQKDDAWRFIQWFVSAETQGDFGIGVEARLGASGRYATANREALKLLPWTAEQAQALSTQWSNVTEMGIIPATYIVERNLSNAFKKVVYNRKNAREVLTTYAFTIDQEIARKNEELNKRAERGMNG